MGGGKSSPNIQESPKPSPVPTYEQQGEPASKAVRNVEAQRLRARRGASGTVLTSPMGSTSSGSPVNNNPTVLGG